MNLLELWDDIKHHRASIILFVKTRPLKQYINESNIDDDTKKLLKHKVWSLWYWGIVKTKKHLNNLKEALNAAYKVILTD